MEKIHIYFMQILFLSGITLGSGCLDLANKHKWATLIARYVIYILTIKGSKSTCILAYDIFHKRQGFDEGIFAYVNRNQVMLYVASLATLFFNDQKLFIEDFPLVFLAYLIVKYPEIDKEETKLQQLVPTVNYGVGMACSFFEGYLIQVIPSDGAKFVGIFENMCIFESREGVIFPVKKLFIIVTKSLHSPPDLKEFNPKNTENRCWMEACKSLEHVEKDVAGVKDRIYRNSAYKIYRPARRPLYLAAECATPIHTLWKVLKNRDLYDELSQVDPSSIVTDFITTVRRITEKSPDTRGKCEIVYFDDLDPSLNLADVLVDRIREIEPDFEELLNNRQ